jgi:2-(3-amino-3-carboxypropyl)histidine synthase
MEEIYFLEEEKIHKEILKHRAERVLVQLPEGLKKKASQITSVIEETGVTAIISGDPCYGACDLALDEAEKFNVDLLIHYGHTSMSKKNNFSIPVLFLEAKMKIDIKKSMERAVNILKPWKKIGLATTVQHVFLLEEVKKILKNEGKTVYVGNTGHIKYPGQIIGCNYSNVKSISDKVEAFLFVGGGSFHAIGLFLATMKPTIVADPFEDEARSIEVEAKKVLKKRWFDIQEAKKAKEFGIIISTKTGQNQVEKAIKIKKALKKKGKKAILLALKEITPMSLMHYRQIDVYINTACPRIALDDSITYAKPMLNIKETFFILEKLKWSDLLKEGLV